jgi:hypothetical protein
MATEPTEEEYNTALVERFALMERKIKAVRDHRYQEAAEKFGERFGHLTVISTLSMVLAWMLTDAEISGALNASNNTLRTLDRLSKEKMW